MKKLSPDQITKLLASASGPVSYILSPKFYPDVRGSKTTADVIPSTNEPSRWIRKISASKWSPAA